MTARTARAFWRKLGRLPREETQSRVLTDGGLRTETHAGYPTRTDDIGSERLKCRRHGAIKPPRILAGKSMFRRDFATAYRDEMIRSGVIRPVVIKGTAIPTNVQGTLSLVR